MTVHSPAELASNLSKEERILEAMARFRKWKYDAWTYPGGLTGAQMFADLFVLGNEFEKLSADEFCKERLSKEKPG